MCEKDSDTLVLPSFLPVPEILSTNDLSWKEMEQLWNRSNAPHALGNV